MIPYEIIAKKQAGGELSLAEVRFMVDGFTAGEVPDYQMSAFLMAVYFRGMTDGETAALVEAMIDSGERIDTSAIPGVKVDKHSTGGVGDKVSLILGPLVAAAGVSVPMISGRGLGHSGGTLDKLESIAGFDVNLSTDRFLRQVGEIGISIIGQSDGVVPADKKMYALRDVTATVRSIPLMCASIMSKKIAEGTDALVLDVKTGRGAFIRELDESRLLAEKLTAIGKTAGLKTTAVITDMSQPLGFAIGNRLEVIESVACLKGDGPPDLMEITLALGAEMLVLGGRAGSPEEGIEILTSHVEDGSGYRKFLEMVEAQGGDVSAVENPEALPTPEMIEITATGSGWLASADPLELGFASVALGAGRSRKADVIDHSAGIVLRKKLGDEVEKGEPLAVVYASDASKLDSNRERISKAFIIASEKPQISPIIHEIIR